MRIWDLGYAVTACSIRNPQSQIETLPVLTGVLLGFRLLEKHIAFPDTESLKYNCPSRIFNHPHRQPDVN